MIMYYVITGLKVCIFFAASMGYWEILRRNTKVNKCFFPALIVAIQVTLLFVAGILNLLQETAFLLSATGVAALLYFIWKDKSLKFFKHYCSIEYYFLIASFLLVSIGLKGKIFIEYDNFSHWGLVVKKMLETNRYPNFQDSIIEFQSYPLGTSTFIYYFSSLINKTESFQLLAQSYISLAALMPLFIFCKKNKSIIMATMLFAANFILVFNIKIIDLSVDTVLPLVGMCAVLYVYMYGKNMKETALEAYLSVFYMVFLLQIKNSGVFFVVIAILWIAYCTKNDKMLFKRLVICGLPFVSTLLWKKHCAYVFKAAGTSKHAMSIDNYQAVFSSKSMTDIKSIVGDLIKASLIGKYPWRFLLILIFAGVLVFLFRRKKMKLIYYLSAFSIGLYVFYQIGMAGMYIFSMPMEEAAILGSYERYNKTVLIAIFYAILTVIIYILGNDKMIKTKAWASMSVLVILMIFANSGQPATIFSEDKENNRIKPWMEVRPWMETVIKQYDIPPYESYCILVPKDYSAGYLRYMARYVFQSDRINTIRSAEEEHLNNIKEKYIFVYEKENKQINKWIKLNYPKQINNSVIIRE